MATVICRSDKCPYRSKKPLKKYVFVTGDGKTHKCYGCKLDAVTFGPIFDCDGDIYGLLGYTPVECEEYKNYRERNMVTNEEILQEEEQVL